MFLSNDTSKNLIKDICNIEVNIDELLLILIGEKNNIDITSMIETLNTKDKLFYGGIFPGVIYDKKSYDDGIVVKTLPIIEKPILIQNYKDIDLKNIATHLQEKNKKTALIIVDGLTENIDAFLWEVFSQLGDSVNYIGGGAGSLSLEQKNCLFNNEGFFQDAAIISFVDMNSNLGVKHGWERIMGPVVASRTNKNVINELNWQDAFLSYKTVIEKDCKKTINKDNFFDIAKSYPFGLYKENSEDIVRDPILVEEEGNLICVGEVPENALLYYLKGDSNNLINAAKLATEDCYIDKKYYRIESLMVDCISRVLFLEEDFEKEIDVVRRTLKAMDEGIVLEGILTLGEISSYGDGMLEFLNKTIVVGILYE